MNSRILLVTLLATLMGSSATAQVQFHLAYMDTVPGAMPATFINDSLFKFASVAPLIRSDELTKAKAFVSHGRATMEINISASARKKFNDLAAQNVLNQETGSIEKYIGLAVVVDGKPTSVIQGVFQPLSENKMWRSPADDRLSQREQLRISNEIVAKISRVVSGEPANTPHLNQETPHP